MLCLTEVARGGAPCGLATDLDLGERPAKLRLLDNGRARRLYALDCLARLKVPTQHVKPGSINVIAGRWCSLDGVHHVRASIVLDFTRSEPVAKINTQWLGVCSSDIPQRVPMVHRKTKTGLYGYRWLDPITGKTDRYLYLPPIVKRWGVAASFDIDGVSTPSNGMLCALASRFGLDAASALKRIDPLNLVPVNLDEVQKELYKNGR